LGRLEPAEGEAELRKRARAAGVSSCALADAWPNG
jgi:hypothetical protein